MVGATFIIFLIIPFFILTIFRIRELRTEEAKTKSRVTKAKIILWLIIEIGLILLAGYLAIVFIIIPPCGE